MDYFREYKKTKSFTCSCGWSGPPDDASKEVLEELTEVKCPKCDRRLALVPHPTLDDVKLAAAEGDEEAMRTLAEANERAALRAATPQLVSAEQLPDVEGDSLEVTMDIVGSYANGNYVLQVGERVLWEERASYEDWARFDELKALLKEKYGLRFRSLTPTDFAEANMMGDRYVKFSYDASSGPTRPGL